MPLKYKSILSCTCMKSSNINNEIDFVNTYFQLIINSNVTCIINSFYLVRSFRKVFWMQGNFTFDVVVFCIFLAESTAPLVLELHQIISPIISQFCRYQWWFLWEHRCPKGAHLWSWKRYQCYPPYEFQQRVSCKICSVQ
mgnify:CR=1 FL=1